MPLSSTSPVAAPAAWPAFAALERQRAEVLASLEDWPAERLVFRPALGAWSAAEVLDHLVRVETAILDATRSGLGSPRPLRVRDRVSFWLLDRLFRTPRRVKAPPSAPGILPASDVRLAEVDARWSAARADLATFLAPLAPESCRAGVFRHPVTGWMSVPQVLRFFWVHTHHHRFQLARLQAAAR